MCSVLARGRGAEVLNLSIQQCRVWQLIFAVHVHANVAPVLRRFHRSVVVVTGSELTCSLLWQVRGVGWRVCSELIFDAGQGNRRRAQEVLCSAMADSDASAAMETDGTIVAVVGTDAMGSAQAADAVAPPPPHGIDALPYADKDYDVPGAREAVRCPLSPPSRARHSGHSASKLRVLLAICRVFSTHAVCASAIIAAALLVSSTLKSDFAGLQQLLCDTCSPVNCAHVCWGHGFTLAPFPVAFHCPLLLAHTRSFRQVSSPPLLTFIWRCPHLNTHCQV